MRHDSCLGVLAQLMAMGRALQGPATLPDNQAYIIGHSAGDHHAHLRDLGQLSGCCLDRRNSR